MFCSTPSLTELDLYLARPSRSWVVCPWRGEGVPRRMRAGGSRARRRLVFLTPVCSCDGRAGRVSVSGCPRALAKAPGGAVRRGVGVLERGRVSLSGIMRARNIPMMRMEGQRPFLECSYPCKALHVTSVPRIAPEVELLVCLSGWVGRDQPG